MMPGHDQIDAADDAAVEPSQADAAGANPLPADPEANNSENVAGETEGAVPAMDRQPSGSHQPPLSSEFSPAPATPRVNDAMRVLSRMQIDLDVATGGKRPATYEEVDTAFDKAIKGLGIRLPSIPAASDDGGTTKPDAGRASLAAGGLPEQVESGDETATAPDPAGSTDRPASMGSGGAAVPASSYSEQSNQPGEANASEALGTGADDQPADAGDTELNGSPEPSAGPQKTPSQAAATGQHKAGARKPPVPTFMPKLPDQRLVPLVRDWPVPGWPDPANHRFPLDKEKGANGLTFADGRYSPDGGFRGTDPTTKKPRHHRGYDLPGKFGDPIGAAADGVVRMTGWAKGWGQFVAVDHADGYTTIYAHLATRAKFKVGQAVTRGTTVGTMGNTGFAKGKGTHLHFEVKVTNGEQTLALMNRTVNPVDWLAGKLSEP